EILNIPQLYLGLLYILTIGAMLQIAFMSVLAILYYLDRKKVAMWLCISFFASNTILTFISIDMGPAMFGYGYTVSLLLVFLASLVVIRNEMDRLDYETFMLQ
ncbi:MAG: exopolysaccharide Pel transporter PelG, partial [Campylobacterota bacterium]|nr:exopolysaccharide Pel transporter PelG [Campylobacterota bacterium]